MTRTYPFKFLDYYTSKDTEIFFGRGEEIKVLHEIIYQTNILLVYGASGTGKTSLILCGLAKKFRPYDWLPVVVRRGDNINESLKKSLSEFRSTPLVSNSEIPDAVRSIYHHYFKPVYLIFDQFEELYIRGRQDEHETFVSTVQELVKDVESVKIIIAIREEYLGNLYPFEKRIPQLMQRKIRVESMTFGKVKDVLQSIDQLPTSVFKLDRQHGEAIIQQIFDTVKGDSPSLTIELTYFQVFMDKLYMKISNDETHQKEVVCTENDVTGMGKIGDVLTEFLDDQVGRIVVNLNRTDVTAEVVWKMLSRFVTSEGTKEPIPQSLLNEKLQDFSPEIIGTVIDSFKNARILRFSDEDRTWEVAHDSLAARIEEKRTDDERARVQIRDIIDSQMTLKGDAQGLLTERQLHLIDTYAHIIELSEDAQKLVARSKVGVKRNRRTRKIAKVLLMGFSIFLACALAIGYYFYMELENALTTKNYLIKEKADLIYENSLKDFLAHLNSAGAEYTHGQFEKAIVSMEAAIKVNENYEEVTQGTDFPIKTLTSNDTLDRFREKVETQIRLGKIAQRVKFEMERGKELERLNETRSLEGFYLARIQYDSAQAILAKIPTARDYPRLTKELNEAKGVLQERMQNSLDRLFERVSKFVAEPEGHMQAMKLLAEAEEFMPQDSRISDFKRRIK